MYKCRILKDNLGWISHPFSHKFVVVKFHYHKNVIWKFPYHIFVIKERSEIHMPLGSPLKISKDQKSPIVNSNYPLFSHYFGYRNRKK